MSGGDKVYKIRDTRTGRWAPLGSYGDWTEAGGKVWWTIGHAKARLKRYSKACEIVEFTLSDPRVVTP